MNKGFTLIELAIVIMVVGLVVGGVTTGQELVHQAKLRRIMSEKENFVRAIFTIILFR